MNISRRRLLVAYFVLVGLLVVAPRAEAVIAPAIGPLQALLALLPYLLAALGTALVGIFKPQNLKKLALFFWHQKLFTAGLMVCVGGVVYGFESNWWMKPKAVVVSRVRTGTDWTAFRGGPERLGSVAGSEEPTTPDFVWEYTRERNFFASPCVVGNRIYITNATLSAFNRARGSGAVLCIDAESGREVWRSKISGFCATFSSPSVVTVDKDTYVVVGEGLHETPDARVVCLDARTGDLLWYFRTNSHVEASPCIYKGRVYIGAGDDGYYAFDLKPKEGTLNPRDPKATPVWHLDPKKYKDCETSPVAADGQVFVGLGEEGRAILSLDADTGEEMWRINTDYPVFTPPAVSNGKLYVGMGNGDFMYSAEEVRDRILGEMRKEHRPESEIAEAAKRLGPIGEVWCIDLKTHSLDWKYRVGQTILGAIAVSGERLYFGSMDRHLYCLSTSPAKMSDRQRLLADRNLYSEIKTSPAVGEKYVYVVTEAGVLHCLTADGLEPVWEMRLGAGPNFVGSPALALGHVFVGTPNDGFRCLGRVGPPPPLLWAHGERGGVLDRSPLPERTQLCWRYPKTSEMKFELTAPLLTLGDGLCVPCKRDGKPELVNLRLEREMRVKDDKGVEQRVDITDEKRVLWSLPLAEPLTIPPAGLAESVYIVTGSRGAAGRLLRCLDVKTGGERWSLPVGSDVSGYVSLDRKHLFAWDAADTLACYPVGTEKAPKPDWRTKVGPGTFAPDASGGLVFVATDDAVLALEELTGTALWSAPAPRPTGSPVRAGRSILLTTEAGVTAFETTTGAVQWTAKVGAVRVPPATGFSARVRRMRTDAEAKTPEGAAKKPVEVEEQHQAAAVVTESGDLVVLDLTDGHEIQRMSGARGAVPPLVGSERLVYAADDLMIVSEAGKAARQWASTQWLGKVISPLVQVLVEVPGDKKAAGDKKETKTKREPYVFFATDAKGIICTRPASSE